MTPSKKTLANRQNAQKSTGPRTKNGKEHSGRNARRQGLAVSIFDSPEVKATVDEAARRIGRDIGLEAHHYVQEIARSSMELGKIRKVRAGLVRAHLDLIGAVRMIASMQKLERYERRALSRRQSALRMLVDGL